MSQRGFFDRLKANPEFKRQTLLTIKVFAVMLAIFGGLWLADAYLGS